MSNFKQPLTYPTVSKSDQIDTYHGTAIADPYRALEDPDFRGNKSLGRSTESSYL